MNKKLKILALSYACCIRVIKESLELMKLGHRVHFMQAMVRHPSFNDVILTGSIYTSNEALAAKLKGINEELGGIDIIHVHNEPSFMASVARQVFPDAKIILDIHDLQKIRGGQWNGDEEKALKDSDGFIYPSKYYQKHINDYTEGKPSTVVYSMCNRETLPQAFYPKVDGLCYQGGITFDNTGADYCDYRELAVEINKRGIPFYIYGANTLYHNTYAQFGSICLPMFDYPPMLQQMTRNKWGLVGAQKKDPQWDRAVPNKLFEYIAAGIVPIVFNAEECKEYVQEHDIGVIAESVDDIADAVRNPLLYKVYFQKIMEERMNFTMETQVEKILNLYKEVLGENK